MSQIESYRLPTEFVKPYKTELSFNNRRTLPLHRLPYVDKRTDSPGMSFWAVPRNGGHLGGCETGSALARIYLKHLRERECFNGGNLQSMVLDMFSKEASSDEEIESLNGQIIGFFSEIERWLEGAAKQLGSGLDSLESKTLLKQVNDGINFDQKAYLDSLPDED